MSPDLKLATAYVMPLGGQDEDAVIKALEKNKDMLRKEVARRVALKFAPDLRFLRDETFDEAERITRFCAPRKWRATPRGLRATTTTTRKRNPRERRNRSTVGRGRGGATGHRRHHGFSGRGRSSRRGPGPSLSPL